MTKEVMAPDDAQDNKKPHFMKLSEMAKRDAAEKLELAIEREIAINLKIALAEQRRTEVEARRKEASEAKADKRAVLIERLKHVHGEWAVHAAVELREMRDTALIKIQASMKAKV